MGITNQLLWFVEYQYNRIIQTIVIINRSQQESTNGGHINDIQWNCNQAVRGMLAIGLATKTVTLSPNLLPLFQPCLATRFKHVQPHCQVTWRSKVRQHLRSAEFTKLKSNSGVLSHEAERWSTAGGEGLVSSTCGLTDQPVGWWLTTEIPWCQ